MYAIVRWFVEFGSSEMQREPHHDYLPADTATITAISKNRTTKPVLMPNTSFVAGVIGVVA